MNRDFTESELADLELDEVSSRSWRHGRKVTYVAHVDGEHWRFEVDEHHGEGWQVFGPISATRVHQIEKIVKIWEPTIP